MIEYLKNSEIDRDQWDSCIRNSQSVKPYGYSWYLDNMAPGWQALVDDDYDSVFPIPGFSRFGIQYIATPIFLQQLGAFAPDKSSAEVLREFLEYLPPFYKFVDLSVAQSVKIDGFTITERTNLELDLSLPYEKIREGFTSDCRRNISLAGKKRPELNSDITPEELINLFRNNMGIKLKGVKLRDYDRLKNLMTYCIENKCGEILGVRTARKRLIYGLFIVRVHGSVTLLFTATTSESLERRIGYFAINEIIKEYSGSRMILDFAGSSIPSVAAFMKSFGSRNVSYYTLYQNRLFWPVKMLK
ncbi:MAG: hypothetical protein A2X05_13205 [Bacteroidetes bacterium GWE2_41_25]|nr:MAG: hypothetical protein A2X03_15535 [Bacteroidetes bacterium GWA2_40_15]OFX98272.1 MAG: hypothetical protein A2X06_05425 [Bacteroidetes bacterium GWC2_40_22]OFY11236.1 MAG: hypothetical protein A2X05_13205 [Bacteroidetes bacterium GWE2_41_25]OFY57065.1 MAG: hypothetical protein A2X04_16505 [Bacteroidetes bacterium GWF2_41_9]HAM11217.1 hypothetical protein [Bacteroidales bacterium]